MIMSRSRSKMTRMKDTNQEVRIVMLPRGGTLELEIMPGFYDKLRAHFGMSSDTIIDDEHIRMFVFGAFKNAIDKAEGDSIGRSA